MQLIINKVYVAQKNLFLIDFFNTNVWLSKKIQN